MDIFLIIFLCFLIAGMVGLFAWIITIMCDPVSVLPYILVIVFTIAMWIGFVLIGIGINTREEKNYIQSYLAQKETIESSLKNDDLTGFERSQLVSKATELNGEFAARKAKYESWYYVYYDNNIYDGIDSITLNNK